MVLNIARNMAIIAITTVLLLITLVACNPASTQQPRYGVKIQYTQGQPLHFPDVTLEFMGKSESPPSDDYPHSMYSFDFKVSQDNQSQLISWSAGTGDIGPTLFELAGYEYALELAMSDKLGILDENELVLWRKVIHATKAPIATPIPTQALSTPTPLSPVKITLDQPFRLALNQYGQLDSTGLSVKFLEIVEDTRCPRQLLCEIPGWARISISVWITDIEPVEYILNTSPAVNENVVLYDEYQVRLQSLDPYPETQEPGIALQDYRATFVVSK